MSDEAAKWKSDAAREALGDVRDGMLLGLGTGSTAEAFVRLLSDRIGEGLRIGGGIPTSERTASLCRELGIPLLTLDEAPRLDLTVDGADEADEDLNLVKGGGGALLREKIVAAASARMIVIADQGKLVETLGRFPLPIEVSGFGLTATALAVRQVAQKLSLPGTIRLRVTDGEPFVTDGGHLILDASFERISDPERLSAALHAVPGVVEHGLFVGLASTLILAGAQGVRRIDRP